MEFRLPNEKISRTFLVLLAVAMLFVVGCSSSSTMPTPVSVNGAVDEEPTAAEQEVESSPNGEIAETASVKTFVLTAQNFKFMMDGKENPDLRISVGDRVRVELTSTSGFHDWIAEEFNAATGKVSDGQSSSVEFVADKKGTFEYYCSIGSHRQMGMKGKLIVS